MKKIIVPGAAAGAVMLTVSILLNIVYVVIFPGLQAEYANSGLFRPWSDPIMQLSYLYPLVVGLVFGWLWQRLKNYFSEHRWGPVMFGYYYWVATLPGMLMSYATFKVSLMMIASWTITNLIATVFGALVVARVSEINALSGTKVKMEPKKIEEEKK